MLVVELYLEQLKLKKIKIKDESTMFIVELQLEQLNFKKNEKVKASQLH